MNCIVKVNKYLPEGKPKLDRHDKASVYLEPIHGTFPQYRNVMCGTIAERLGLELGKLYHLTIEETEEHPQYGRQFKFRMLKEFNTLDLIGINQKVEIVSTNSQITTNFAENEKVISSDGFKF